MCMYPVFYVCNFFLLFLTSAVVIVIIIIIITLITNRTIIIIISVFRNRLGTYLPKKKKEKKNEKPLFSTDGHGAAARTVIIKRNKTSK